MVPKYSGLSQVRIDLNVLFRFKALQFSVYVSQIKQLLSRFSEQHNEQLSTRVTASGNQMDQLRDIFNALGIHIQDMDENVTRRSKRWNTQGSSSKGHENQAHTPSAKRAKNLDDAVDDDLSDDDDDDAFDDAFDDGADNSDTYARNAETSENKGGYQHLDIRPVNCAPEGFGLLRVELQQHFHQINRSRTTQQHQVQKPLHQYRVQQQPLGYGRPHQHQHQQRSLQTPNRQQRQSQSVSYQSQSQSQQSKISSRAKRLLTQGLLAASQDQLQVKSPPLGHFDYHYEDSEAVRMKTLAHNLAFVLHDLSNDFNRDSLTLSIMEFPNALDGMLSVWSESDLSSIKEAQVLLNGYSIREGLRFLKIAIDALRLLQTRTCIISSPHVSFLHLMFEEYRSYVKRV